MTANKAPRNILIEKKRNEGATLASLAKEFGVTPETIRGILAKLASNRRKIARRVEEPLRHVTRPYNGD